MMESTERTLVFIYLLFDLFIINASILLTSYLFLDVETVADLVDVSPYVLHANISWLIVFFVIIKERYHVHSEFYYRFIVILKRNVTFAIVAITLAFFLLPRYFSREFILQYIALSATVECLFYFIVHKYSMMIKANKINLDDSIIINCSQLSSTLRTVIENNPLLGYHFRGYLCDNNPKGDRVLGDTSQLAEIIDRCDITVVFVVISIFGKDMASREDLLHICNEKGVRLYFVPESQHWFTNNSNLRTLGGITLINPQIIPLDDFSLRLTKRLFDVVFSLLVIVLLFSWLFPILSILIKVTSKGPVFFVQTRSGINNKMFRCFKFRSMQMNDEADVRQATKYDERITVLGRFMRRTNIDELPQFFNVLWGNMSVVGPRPHMLKHTDIYSTLIKDFKTRQYVKPGITGWAQVEGFRGETKELWQMERRVDCDMKYIHNWTFTWDLKIILLTVFGKSVLKNAV